MSEETIQESAEQISENTPDSASEQNQGKDESLEKVKAAIKAELEEKYKEQIIGLNKKVNEKAQIVKKFEREQMTAKEQAEADKAEYEERLRNLEQRERESLVKSKLSDAGMSLEFAKRITGKDESEIDEDIKELQRLLEQQKKEDVEKAINERLGGKSPEAGTTPSNDLKTQYENFRKAGKTAEALAIKRQAQREGIIL